MFRNRTSSLKPGVDFIANFRQSFPEVSTVISPGSASGNTSIGGALVETPNLERNPSLGHEDMKDLESTPRAQHESWRYTPSLLDPSSFAFSPFANQPPGYYSPTPGGTNTPWSNPSVDLQTPGMNLALGLQTPLSLPTSADGLHGGPMLDMTTFGHQMLPQFQNYNPFNQHSSDPSQQPASFTPSSFIQTHEAAYDPIEHHGSPMDDDVCLQSMDGNLTQHQSLITYPSTSFNLMGLASMPLSAEKFRFHVTLNAPTAMIKHADEIPVTYLNKGQAYSFSVVDTVPSMPLSAGTRYRTFVRISFESEQQRQRPSTCWQLWKEGRGTNEAHQRGGKLQAVEYVEASQPAENDDKRTRVELDTASFDGFSVIWTPGKNGLAECNIAVRFNFLSTDFSHSKGVKGIPVRLCAKTQPLSNNSLEKSTEFSEVAYCKVKLFRDHGAERKLSNDVAHVKKSIDKLNQQIAQSESGMKDFGKRKRTGSSTMVKSHPSQRPGKVHKHKRTWSMSSASSSGGRLPVEEDLYLKLQTMKDMFTSTRPVSILYLRGSDQDDPDLYPVTLPGEPLDLTKVDSRVSTIWQQRSNDRGSNSGIASALVSPSSNNTPLSGQGISASVPANPHWSDYSAMAPGELHSSNPQHLASPPDQPIKIAKTDETGNLNGWIEALGVDPSYKPPLERPNKAVACFYIMRQDPNQTERQEYHRAVYLSERTLLNFTQGIAAKWNIDHQKIVRTLRILERGLQVEMDDDIIAGLNEGQDLVMEVISINLSIEGDHSSGTVDKAVTEGLELRLIF